MDDVLHIGHQVGGPCSPARSSRPSEFDQRCSTSRRLSAGQIDGEMHHLCPSVFGTQTSAPPQSSALHIRDLTVGVTANSRPPMMTIRASHPVRWSSTGCQSLEIGNQILERTQGRAPPGWLAHRTSNARAFPHDQSCRHHTFGMDNSEVDLYRSLFKNSLQVAPSSPCLNRGTSTLTRLTLVGLLVYHRSLNILNGLCTSFDPTRALWTD